MFMLTLFETKKARTEKTHLRNVITLAKADGKLSKSELNLIYKIGEARGLKNDEIQDLLQEIIPSSDIVLPNNDTERFNQIFDLVELMLADGRVADQEVDFCIEIAEKFGFSKAFAGVVVNKIAMDISAGQEKESIKEGLSTFLSF
jgi:uncharacterized tellurite resistance protein B-like protein